VLPYEITKVLRQGRIGLDQEDVTQHSTGSRFELGYDLATFRISR
jgi:hypothetical protein